MTVFLILTVAALYQSCFSSSFLTVRPYIDITEHAELFPDTYLNFTAKFKRDSTLFEVASNVLAKGIEFDTENDYVIAYYRLFDEDIRSSRVLKLKDYIELRSEYETRSLWLNSVEKNIGVEYSSIFQGGEIALDIPFKIKSETFHRVFGGDNIGLRVRGSISISVTGQRSYTDLPNVENTSFDFSLDQTQNFSIRGEVGSKVNVDIAQNTESFDFENSLKITYTGESDEIIQKMEAGNIGLSLPGTRFVSFSGVNKGLFGLKTETKVGRLKTTSIASFEKGNKNQIEIKGGVRKQEKIRNAKDYARYKYFYIEELFKNNMARPENYERIKEHKSLLAPPYKIKNYSLELYVTRTESGAQPTADIFIDYENRQDSLINGYENHYIKNRTVKLIDDDQYEINHELGYIRLKSFYLRGGDILGVRYVKQKLDGTAEEIEIGSIDPTATELELQILAEYGQTWDHPWNDLEWKNVYSLDGVDINSDGFKLTIEKDTPVGMRREEYDKDDVARPYLYWYEVSKTDVTDEVDLGFLISSYGEFIFPNQTPFMPDSNSIIYSEGKADSLFIDSRIYKDNYYQSSQFNLNFEFASKSSTYDLGFNVIEGSEVVRSGATTLTKDVDYVINYNSGQLSIINESYLNSDIEILYESASIFQLDQKLLLGSRFEYDINENSYLGATVLYLSEDTEQEKVHVGYEPKRNLILGMNGQTSFEMPFLTRSLDNLFFVSTEKESSMNIEGEIAQIHPNPNPLNAAYIDDFESSRIKKSMGISYRTWSESSYPDQYEFSGSYTLIDEPFLTDTLNISKQYFLKSYSGSSELSYYWYNPKDEDKLTKEDIYRDVPGEEKTDKVNTLNFVFKPSINEDAFTTIDFDPKDSWGGVMRYLHHSYQDFKEVRYIEFLVSANKNVSIHFDIGELSEDVIPNGVLDTEDRNRNNVLDIGDNTEDTGIDGMKGPGGFHALYGHDADSPRENKEPYEFYSYDIHPGSDDNPTPDSELDNYWDYIKTEGNGLMDSEDLDGGRHLDTNVRAYRYSVDLKSNPLAGENYVVSTAYKQGSNFALYRIPIEEFDDILKQAPDMSKIKYIKIWMNNSSDAAYETRVNFVSLDLVGNEWSAKGDNKGKIEAKTVNNEDNKDRYYSPPGVKEFDDYGFEKPEQSLALNISLDEFMDQDEYENGRFALLSKDLYKGENYLQYEEIKMFVHGGESSGDQNWDGQRPMYFLYRFGTDSANYYEYRSKLVNGWKNETVNNQMVIKLKDLSDLKTFRSDSDFPADSLFLQRYNDDQISRYIGIKGNPTLQSVKYFNTGIIDSANTSLDTEIWINELRLAKIRKNPGTAMRAKVRLQAADVATVDAEITKQDENFHRIDQNRGNGTNQMSMNLNTSFNMHKVMPRSLGLSVPVRYSYNRSSSYSKYQGSTDILVDKDNIPDSVRTETTRNQVNFSLTRTDKSDSPYLKYTVDNLRLSGNMSFGENSNSSYVYQRSKSYNYNMTYSLAMPESWFSFRPFGWGDGVFFFNSFSGVKFKLLPNNYNFSLNTGQSETISLSRRDNYSENRSFLVTRNFSTSLSFLPFMSTNYNMVLKSDMYREAQKKDDSQKDTVVTAYNRDMTDIFMLEFGELSSLQSTLKNKFGLNILDIVTNDLDFNTAYAWNANLNSNTVTSGIKNRYDSKLSSRLKTREVINKIQSGIGYILPEKNDSTKNRNGNDKKISVLDFLKNNLSDVSLSYSQGRENSYSDIRTLDQADPAFFFGFGNEPTHIDSIVSSSWSGGWDMKGSTRLSITNNLNLDGISYQFARSYRENNNDGFAGNDSKTGFVWPFVTDEVHKKQELSEFLLPNYSITISRLQDMLKTKDYISSISINHSKSGTNSTQWYLDGYSPEMYLTGIPDLGSVDTKVRSYSLNTSFSPLVGLKINLKNGLNFSSNYNYTFDVKENYSYTDEEKRIQSGEKKYSREFRVSGGYNQRGGFDMPLNFWPFKGVTLDNDIRYNLTLSYSSNDRYKYDIGNKEYESLDKGIKSNSFTANPDITYRISKNLNGTLSYSYNYNESQDYEAKSVVNTNHKFELRAILSISGR
ncbi:MAG: cell surface protein SprA [Candidatus Delongbacteria bacterium]